jgi:hypothetical protein
LSRLSLEADLGSGKFANIRDGNVRWPAIRAARDKTGYNGTPELSLNFGR